MATHNRQETFSISVISLIKITSFDNGTVSEAYSYDAVGNMLAKKTADADISMRYNAGNQLVDMSNGKVNITYSYDKNGNMTSKSLGDEKDTYSYNVQNNLVAYNGYDGYMQSYKYSALGMMYEKTSSGNDDRVLLESVVTDGAELPTTDKNSEDGDSDGDDHQLTTYYTYDALLDFYQVLTETTGDETIAYEYGHERIAAYTEATDAESVKSMYVYDVGGSVIQTVAKKYTDSIAEMTTAPKASVPVITSYSYSPFGELLDSPAVSGYTYNAEYYDAATGMINLRARHYEPQMMRFAQKDILQGSMLEPISLNRYLYCQNNPLDFSDPSGMSIWSKLKSAAKTVAKTVVATTVKTAAKVVKTAAKVTATAAKAVSTVSKAVAKASTAVSNVAAKVAASTSSPTLKKLANTVSKGAAKVSNAATTVSKTATKVATTATKVAKKADAVTKMSTDQIVTAAKATVNTVVKTVKTTVKSVVNTVASCAKTITNKVTTFYKEHSEIIHTALDVVGMIPGLGDVCDAVNAGLYLLEGDYANAALSAVSLIPFGGAVATIGKFVGKHGDTLIKGAVKHGDKLIGAVKKGSDLVGGLIKKGSDLVGGLVKKGSDLVSGLFKKNGDEIISAVAKNGDDAAEAIAKNGGEIRENVVKCTNGGCFVAGTLVLTPDGYKAIEEIQPGDTVIATDPETGETAEKIVEAVAENYYDELVHITVAGEEIVATTYHPFYVPEKGWTSAVHLKVGDKLQLVSGEYAIIEAIEREYLDEPVAVYNYEIRDFHTYHVGESGVLVHNGPDGSCPSGSIVSKHKTGPKPQGTGAHNLKIEEIASQVTDGTVIAGGGRICPNPEAIIQTPNGLKKTRRPDILVQKPDGTLYGINVGKTTAKGAPVKREVEALYDLEDHGLPMYFVGYDK